MTYESLHAHADHTVEIRSEQGCATVECYTCSKTVHVAIRTADHRPADPQPDSAPIFTVS